MREEKGCSLISFPSDFIVIDIETTGLSPEWDSIIEISAVKCVNGEEVDAFTSLIQPPALSDGVFINSYIEELTGITNEMLKSVPPIESILPDLYRFFGSSILIGHNVNFDINFLYDNFMDHLHCPLCNDFVDTMRISRRLHPEAPHHRLSDLCARYSLDYTKAHRSLEDCKLTLACYRHLLQEIETSYDNMDIFKKSASRTNLKSSDIHAESLDFDPSHPLYGKTCVFTGALERMVRRDAMQLVANLGGINADSVTKKTNFLILGNNDYCKSIKDGKSSKQKKAEKLKLEGFDIEILPETAFYDMLDSEY